MQELERLHDATGHLYGEDEAGHLAAVPVFLVKPKKTKTDMRWLLLWQPDDTQRGGGISMYEQAVDGKLTLTDYRVRDYMLCMCGIGNFVHFNQSAASRELGIAQPNISASIKRLIDMGIVLEGPKAGKFRTYQINPALAFAGGLRAGVRAQRDIVRQAKTGARVYKFPAPQA